LRLDGLAQDSARIIQLADAVCHAGFAGLSAPSTSTEQASPAAPQLSPLDRTCSRSAPSCQVRSRTRAALPGSHWVGT
jgi:hypothetical protein